MTIRRQLRPRSRARRLRARWTNRGRALPDFLILGTQKGGTDSLYTYLSAQPNVIGIRWKETYYFAEIPNPDHYVVRGPGWYRSHFPLRSDLRAADAITGEATPRYMVEELAMSRITRDLPDSRWIVVLRDPVERAHSHHAMKVRQGPENAAFADAVERELELIGRGVSVEGSTDVIGSDRDYVGGGRYSEQLRFISSLRPGHPTLVLFSEHLFEGDPRSFVLLHEFLGLPAPDQSQFPHANAATTKEEFDPHLRSRLKAFFAQANAELSAQLRSDQFLTVDPTDWPDWVPDHRP